MLRLLPLFVVLTSAPAWASNYATCILDRMGKAQNDVAASAVHQVCSAEHPGGLDAVAQGSGRGWFSFDSGAACVAKKAADTHSNRAAVFIGVACRALYDKPVSFTYEEAYGLPPAQR